VTFGCDAPCVTVTTFAVSISTKKLKRATWSHPLRTEIPFAAVIVTGLAMTGPAAHLFALPNKIGMSRADYFVAQSIYMGWWRVGLLLPSAIVANLALAYVMRGDRPGLWLALIATALVAVELVVYAVWTQPANSVTANWTVVPANWEALRAQWEYSHAVNAFVMLAAFCCSTASALRAS
jgi:hypothetical protein